VHDEVRVIDVERVEEGVEEGDREDVGIGRDGG
jgi:hypothetical protein